MRLASKESLRVENQDWVGIRTMGKTLRILGNDQSVGGDPGNAKCALKHTFPAPYLPPGMLWHLISSGVCGPSSRHPCPP